jgi:hypothetical protein
MGTLDRVRTYLREAYVAHVTLLHEFGDRAYGLLYGNVWVKPRGLVEIDLVGAKACECISKGSLHRRGARVVADKRSLRITLRAELHLYVHAVSLPIAQRFTDEKLVTAHAVEISGVQQRDTGIQGRVDSRDTLPFICRTIEI